MDVKAEIEAFSSEEDKPILRWLFDRYHLQSKWSFVALCSHKRYGTLSYQTNRVWRPTVEGMQLYLYNREHGKELTR
jgi:hypothetical protein